MSRRGADIAIVSLGTTLGWRRADEALAQALAEAGHTCTVVRVAIGPAGWLRRSMVLTDVVEAAAARRAAAAAGASVAAARWAGRGPRAVIFSSITAALLQPTPRIPHAVRFDSLARMSRPGLGGVWQRRREPTVLARATLLLPWGDAAAQAAGAALAEAGSSGPPVVPVPVPVASPTPGAAVDRDVAAVAYAANPDKRGLVLLCRAWSQAASPGEELVITGLAPAEGRRWLARHGEPEPVGVHWAGALPHREWLALLSRARCFVNASRYEDWGIAPLEALAAGVPVATVATPGPFEALALIRRLEPGLVAEGERSADSLAGVVRSALELDTQARARFAADARTLLEPYRPEAVREAVATRVVPALLGSVA